MGVSKKSLDPLLQTHYEILGLQRNCSPKQIRDAFVAISKKVHPDVNKDDPDCHKSFLKLNEAYSVLSKPYKRQLYDASLVSRTYGTMETNFSSWVETNAPFGKVNEFRDETLWESRDKSKDKYYKDKPYYGIKGVQRISNKYIAAGCVVFMLVGAAFHFIVVKKSSTKALEALNQVDQESTNWYLETRRKARASSTSEQIERLTKEWEANDKFKKYRRVSNICCYVCNCHVNKRFVL
ncbi:dnaJ-like protein 60 isoform X1 [Daphnia carinata]|uniref:dnaJ-like protein 60 isoform X1 n=2 Tax=Daphnia carinata TaxID=120202 RepID=UPI002868CAFA|nr:dnaJ-like protein 60 isoform X1 [Daphnia carinata]